MSKTKIEENLSHFWCHDQDGAWPIPARTFWSTTKKNHICCASEELKNKATSKEFSVPLRL